MAEPAPASKTDVAAGLKTLAGKLEIVEAISRGAYGQIYKVRHPDIDKLLAAKVLTPDAANPDAFKRLAREAQALCKLQHPNIVKVHSSAFDDKAGLVVVMDYLEGQTLSELIKQRRPLETKLVVQLAKQIASGLQNAHENGVLHRDVKPSNVIVLDADTEAPRAVLIDFGIAKFQDASQKLTQTGSVIGTPMYMSPEQFIGHPADSRSDIYSFGCLLYEMLTGVPPFQGENAVELAARHHSEQPMLPSDANPMVPCDLDRITSKCLSKNPDQRYQDFLQVIDDLDTCNFTVLPKKERKRRKIVIKAASFAVPMIITLLGGLAFAAYLVYDQAKQPTADQESERQYQHALDRARAELYKHDFDDADSVTWEITRHYEEMAPSYSLRQIRPWPPGLTKRLLFDAYCIRSAALLMMRDPDENHAHTRFNDVEGVCREGSFFIGDVRLLFPDPEEFVYAKTSLVLTRTEAILGSPSRWREVTRDLGSVDGQTQDAKTPLDCLLRFRCKAAGVEYLTGRDEIQAAKALMHEAEEMEKTLKGTTERESNEIALWTYFAHRRFAWIKRLWAQEAAQEAAQK